MKIRKSFFIRWLMTKDTAQNEQYVFDIEHIQSGDKMRVNSLEQADEWMKTTGNAQSKVNTEE
jgi:hypothetical protein